jgi:sec-independent protein translocase protein TatA
MGLFDSPTHLLIILAVLVVLFGSAKLPKAAKSMGEAMRIFKKESAKLHDEDSSSAPKQVQEWTPEQVAPPQPQATPQQTAQEQQMAALQQQLDALKQQQTAAQPPPAAQQPPVAPPPATPAPQPETQHTNQSS